MKNIFYILTTLLIVTYVYCQRENWRKAAEECRNEVGITEDFRKLSRDDMKIKCFRACTMKKMGKMEDGKILPEKAFEILKQRMPDVDESVNGKLNVCAEKANEESDECEVAAAFGKCIFESIGPNKHRRQQKMFKQSF